MAKVAEQYADFIVVTDDNPRTEESSKIISDICSGFSEKSNDKLTVVSDRKMAITQTLNGSNNQDVILIAGKGHEDYQEINGIKHPFSDQETVSNWQELNNAD